MDFHHVLSNAGRSFLRAFGSSIIVLAPGVASAPNLDGAKALGVAGLVASFTAGLRVLQDYIPFLQFNVSIGGLAVGDYLGSFARAGLGSFITTLVGILAAPELSFSTSLVTGLLTGAVAAGFLAVQQRFEGTNPK